MGNKIYVDNKSTELDEILHSDLNLLKNSSDLSNSNLENTLYKACHTGHPSTVWVMSNYFHYSWLYDHMIALNAEFKIRYNHTKDHMTIQKLKEVLRTPPKNIPVNDITTDPTPAMPDECKILNDVVGSYRKYYIMKKKEFL